MSAPFPGDFPITRRTALQVGTVGLTGIGLNCLAASEAQNSVGSITHGPFIGHVTPTSASVWCRFSQAGRYTLTLNNADGQTSASESLQQHSLS
jgi:hypothetical protein